METKNTSFNRIVKTTSIFGSSQVVNMLMGLIRTKVIAVLLGAIGVGLIGIYQNIVDMVRAFSGLGLDMGSMREIAKADSSGDSKKVTYTVSVFKRWFIGTAILGALTCILLSYPISKWAFEDTEHALPIMALAATVFFIAISTGRSVVLQGLRRISFMAKATVLESILGIFIIIPIYYFFGIDGVIPVLILNSIVVFLCVNHFYRKLKIEPINVSNKEAFKVGMSTLRLGIFIIAGNIFSTVSMFAIRTYIGREMDMESVGLFQSAWSITAVYIGLILGSTGSDTYPRLCAVADDKAQVKRLINEQLYIILIIATPIIVGMLLLPDLALSLLYTSKFSAAKSILLWQVAGSFFKVLASPVASVMLAKNKGKLYLISEAVFYITYLLISYLLISQIGIAAVGLAYMVAYIVYLAVALIIVNNISGFTWNASVMQMIVFSIVFIIVTGLLAYYAKGNTLIIGGIIIFAFSAGYSVYKLSKVFSIKDLINHILKKD